jgi:hypothetical protein
MNTRSILPSLFILAFLTSHMTTVASSWWPFGRGSTAAQSADAKKSKIRNLQRQAFINQNKLPDDETTKKIYDYIEKLRSIKTLTFKNISFANMLEWLNVRDNIRRAAELINLVKKQALLNPVYGPICCKEIQKSVIDAKFKNSSLNPLLIWFASEKIRALTELALSDNNLASLVLPLFKDPNLIVKSKDPEVEDPEYLALTSIQKIQRKWASDIELTEPMHYMRDECGGPTYNTFQLISHMAQQLINARDPFWFEGKEDEIGLSGTYTPSDLIADVKENNYDGVYQGLKQGVDVNQNIVLQQGDTLSLHNALHIAARREYTEIVQLLILHKANINLKAGKYLDTPLHEAVLAGNIRIINILLNAHADANATDSRGYTPLHYAIHSHHENVQIKVYVVEALLSAGADTQIAACTGETPLESAKTAELTILKIVQTAATEQIRWSPGRSTLMSTIMRLANNSKLKVDDRAGRGKFVPDTSTAAGTSGGASASASDSVATGQFQRYVSAPAITDDSDDEGGEKDADTLNSSHPGADAGAYDDMPALEFVGSDNDGEAAEPEESKGGEE